MYSLVCIFYHKFSDYNRIRKTLLTSSVYRYGNIFTTPGRGELNREMKPEILFPI